MNVFDFDKTIFKGDSTAKFYKYCLKKYPKVWLHIPSMGAAFTKFYVFKKGTKTQCKEVFYRFLTAIPDVDAAVEDFWSKSDSEILDIALKECEKYNLFKKENILKSFVVKEKKAYPAYHGSYQHINRIKEFLSTIENLHLLGRNGQHKDNNMDEAMLSGINIANKIKDK